MDICPKLVETHIHFVDIFNSMLNLFNITHFTSNRDKSKTSCFTSIPEVLLYICQECQTLY